MIRQVTGAHHVKRGRSPLAVQFVVLDTKRELTARMNFPIHLEVHTNDVISTTILLQPT